MPQSLGLTYIGSASGVQKILTDFFKAFVERVQKVSEKEFSTLLNAFKTTYSSCSLTLGEILSNLSRFFTSKSDYTIEHYLNHVNWSSFTSRVYRHQINRFLTNPNLTVYLDGPVSKYVTIELYKDMIRTLNADEEVEKLELMTSQNSTIGLSYKWWTPHAGPFQSPIGMATIFGEQPSLDGRVYPTKALSHAFLLQPIVASTIAVSTEASIKNCKSKVLDRLEEWDDVDWNWDCITSGQDNFSLKNQTIYPDQKSIRYQDLNDDDVDDGEDVDSNCFNSREDEDDFSIDRGLPPFRFVPDSDNCAFLKAMKPEWLQLSRKLAERFASNLVLNPSEHQLVMLEDDLTACRDELLQ